MAVINTGIVSCHSEGNLPYFGDLKRAFSPHTCRALPPPGWEALYTCQGRHTQVTSRGLEELTQTGVGVAWEGSRGWSAWGSGWSMADTDHSAPGGAGRGQQICLFVIKSSGGRQGRGGLWGDVL